MFKHYFKVKFLIFYLTDKKIITIHISKRYIKVIESLIIKGIGVSTIGLQKHFLH